MLPPIGINGFTKYEQDPLNIVGSGEVTEAGRADGRTDRRCMTRQYTLARIGEFKNWENNGTEIIGLGTPGIRHHFSSNRGLNKVSDILDREF